MKIFPDQQMFIYGLQGKRILVTGAGGFLGQALFRYLQRTIPEARVMGTCRRGRHKEGMMFACDFSNRKQVLATLKRTRPEVLFHLVGSRSSSWPDLYQAHMFATVNLFESVLRTKKPWPRILIVGSAAEYGNIPRHRQPIREEEIPRPQSPYAISKEWQTALAESYAARKLPVVIARVFNVVGPGAPDDLSVGRFSSLLRKNGRRILRVESMHSVRDFLSLEDVCNALIALISRGRSGQVYNVCSGRGVRMRTILDEMASYLNVRVRVHENTNKRARSHVDCSIGSRDKIYKDVGWAPRFDWRHGARQLVMAS